MTLGAGGMVVSIRGMVDANVLYALDVYTNAVGAAILDSPGAKAQLLGKAVY